MTEAGAECLIVEREGAHARLVLNRPQALNAFNLELVEALSQAVDALAEDPTVRVLTVEGAGTSFCAGADLKYFLGIVESGPLITAYIHRIKRMLNALEAFPHPVIAVVHGYALAGGLELMLACDLAIAAEDARLGDQHINFGLLPGGGASQRLPRLLGERKAKEVMFLGSWMDGREAERLGLVNRAVPATELQSATRAWVAMLLEKSPTGIGIMKDLVHRGGSMPLDAGIELEAARFLEYARLPDLQEGLRAFKEKRKPRFA